MYVLALSDYKYIFKACCCRGLKTRPPIRQFTHTIHYRGNTRRKQLLLQFVNIDDFVDNSINGESCNRMNVEFACDVFAMREYGVE